MRKNMAVALFLLKSAKKYAAEVTKEEQEKEEQEKRAEKARKAGETWCTI